VVSLSGAGSLLVSDALTHASLVDACRLSRARVVVTPHRDVSAVEAALAARDEERAVVVTDSVFSADGVLAPLRALHDVCRRHGALLIVDEAHGLGVRGSGGRGLLHEVGLAGAPDVVMTTTLSKALGTQGGVVLGPAAVRAHLIDAARPFIFDTGLAPAAVGAAWAALRVLVDGCAQAVLISVGAAGAAFRVPGFGVSVIWRARVAPALACLDRGVRVGCSSTDCQPAPWLRLTARASLSNDEMALARVPPSARFAPVSIQVVTAPTPASARRWPPRRSPVMRGCRRQRRRANPCRPAARDDDLADVARRP
jgi:8-amino-7-oxononanoate synthase